MDLQVFDAVCERVAGGESLRSALADNGINPNVFYPAIRAHDELAKRYARAKECQLDAMAEDIIDIADEQPPTVTKTNREGAEDDYEVRLDSGFVAWQRNRIDSRKWLLSKLVPKKYGDKVDVTHAGDPDRPLVARIEEVIIDSAD